MEAAKTRMVDSLNEEIKTRIEMINRGEVPEGYKQTKVGIIPEDWEVLIIEDIAEIYLGLTYTPTYVAEGIPFLSVKDIKGCKINFDDVKYISEEEFKNSTNNAKPKKGDILFGRVGTLGNPIIITEEVEFCIFVSLGYLRIKRGDVLNWFVKYWMDSEAFEKQIYAKIAGSSQKNLNTGWLKKFNIYLPSLKEQQKIAQILSTWDQAIELKEKLIEEKKKQKKGLMQKLLTGEVRLAGFDGEWEEVRLGEVSDIKTGDKNNEDKVENGKYPFFVRSEEIERIDSYSYDGEAILVPGDGRIGVIYHYINGKFDYHQRVYKISDFINETSGKYVYYYLKQFFKRQAMKYTAKATVDSLRMPMLTEMPILIPKSLQEQKAIAKILTTADKEIDLLEKELEQLKLQKKGLMQLLLTGIIRVKS